MGHAFVVGSLKYLQETIDLRLQLLAKEAGLPLILPVGLFLVIDAANGGNDIAQELVKRVHLLDQESKNVIDFYYLGWRCEKGSIPSRVGDDALEFNLQNFVTVREGLSRLGIREFGGNANLVVLDAEMTEKGFFLNFGRVIRIDLAADIKSGRFVSLGDLTERLIRGAEEVRMTAATGDSPVCRISNHLGLVYSRQSILDALCERFGKWFGAPRLQSLAVTNAGPRVSGSELARM